MARSYCIKSLTKSLLLFSRSIDANGTFSRMVFDQWLELRFGSAIEAQEMMWRAARLRTTWQGGIDYVHQVNCNIFGLYNSLLETVCV